MSQSPAVVSPWRCKVCHRELGRILDGVLRVAGRVVTADRWGVLAVRCECGEPKFWRPERYATITAGDN